MKKNTTNAMRWAAKGYRQQVKDSDNDSVPDAWDCSPHNPKKQGIVHNLWQKTAEKLEVRKKQREEEKEEAYVRKTMAEDVARKERRKQAILTAEFKERERGEQERKRYKTRASQPSFGQMTGKMVLSTLDSVTRPTRKTKTSKRKRVRRPTRKTTSRQKQDPFDFSSLF